MKLRQFLQKNEIYFHWKPDGATVRKWLMLGWFYFCCSTSFSVSVEKCLEKGWKTCRWFSPLNGTVLTKKLTWKPRTETKQTICWPILVFNHSGTIAQCFFPWYFESNPCHFSKKEPVTRKYPVTFFGATVRRDIARNNTAKSHQKSPVTKSKKLTRETPKKCHGLSYTVKLVEKNPSMTNPNENHNQGEPNFVQKMEILIRGRILQSEKLLQEQHLSIDFNVPL